MRISRIGFLMSVFGLFFVPAAHADSVAVFPFKTVNTPLETARAVVLVFSQHLEGKGFTVVSGEALLYSATPLPTVDAKVEGAESHPSVGSAAATASTDGALAPAPTEVSAPAAAAPAVLPEAMSVAAVGAGCRFYLTGSLVQLGTQLTITIDLFLSDGARIAGKKIISPDERSLPGAIQTVAFSVSDEMLRYREAPAPAPASAEVSPRRPAQTAFGFQKNFGLMIGQTFSVTDAMYSFLTFSFNGRFEFNRLLMITNAGFSLGNKNPEDGFHFSLNLSLAGYLLKTQVTPYLGGGFGFFIGNRMNDCAADEYGYEDCSNDDSLVGWDVFPVVGLEILRTMSLRVHVEGRYLVTFNGYGSWGHGPAVMMGVAF